MRTSKRQQQQKTFDFALIGRVKVGELIEGQYGKKYPTSLDYFRFAPYGENASRKYVELAEAAYPHSKENPRKEILITFPSDSEGNCDNFFILRNAQGKEVARTDMHNHIRLSMTEKWMEWVAKNGMNLCSPPQSTKDSFLNIYAEDFGENKIPGNFESFVSRLRESEVKKAVEAKQSRDWDAQKIEEAKQKMGEQIEWKEVLILRFVLVNYPIQGRWELQTSATKSSINELLNTYDAIKQARGSVVGVHFVLQCQKVKSNRDGVARQYTTISMAPLITEDEIENGGMLINSLTTIHKGIKVIAAPEPTKEGYSSFDEV